MKKKQSNYEGVEGRAGRSPTFQDPGTPLYGLAGTRVPSSPIEELLSGVPGESFDVELRVPGYPLAALVEGQF